MHSSGWVVYLNVSNLTLLKLTKHLNEIIKNHHLPHLPLLEVEKLSKILQLYYKGKLTRIKSVKYA